MCKEWWKRVEQADATARREDEPMGRRDPVTRRARSGVGNGRMRTCPPQQLLQHLHVFSLHTLFSETLATKNKDMTDTELYTPSPSSSPSLAPIDSSPPSSPSPLALCTPPASPGAKDPFAGSTKSIKRPRIYARDDARRRAANIQPYTPDHAKPGEAGNALAPDLDPDNATPTRVVDPFSGSAKRAWRPPTYEKKDGRVMSTDSAFSASSSTSYAYGTRRGTSPTPIGGGITMSLDDPDDDFVLTDDELDQPKAKLQQETKEEVEHRAWDEAITAAIDKLSGIVDLTGTSLRKGPISHIPPSIADLEGFVVLPPTQAPSSAPSSPEHSPKLLPLLAHSSDYVSSSRPFIRATTLPAAAFNDNFFLRSKDGERLRGTPAARAASLQSVAVPASSPLRRREIQLFLANNTITHLPAELFRVSSLTVLSLRSNALTTIPPQIVHLTSLKELNVAQNKLRWLPAEMLSMCLTKLTVAGNPWVPPPLSSPSPSQPSTAASESTSRRSRPVSETAVRYVVPPLTELCFRALFAPYHPHPPLLYTHTPPHVPTVPSPPSSTSHPSSVLKQPPSGSSTNPTPAADPPPRTLTVLEAAYALPLTEDLGLGPSVLATFRACVPAAVAKPTAGAQFPGPSKVRRDEGQRDVHSQAPDDDVFGGARTRRASSPPETRRNDEDEHAISVCPSPAHVGQTRTPVFVRAAEERFTWEEVIAGVRVGGDGVGGVGVPVRWRGCGHECLAFLTPEPQPAPALAPTPTVDDDVDVDIDIPLEGDGDVEMSEGGIEVDIQEVHFDGGLADPEDFEEAF
ncbi:hypothetical protein TRAPUB_10543 [Trametes pubescens]|uniref:Leucine-rich repeat-containing protein 40 n=1 Tax=Trametes pubescens TaxID=154538 RepID=A0A1M2VZG4_TRAPU|nr:hypothetical protein TRAPUB_10543 [Trametes pubescens]